MAPPLLQPRRGGRASRPGSDRLVRREGAPLCVGRKRGETTQAIGRSRGGRTTKIHALTDRFCRPLVFLLTGGNVADCTARTSLLPRLPGPPRRQGLRRRRDPPTGRGGRRSPEHTRQGQPPLEAALLAGPLSPAKRRRENGLPSQGLATRRHAVRPPRGHGCAKSTVADIRANPLQSASSAGVNAGCWSDTRPDRSTS